MKKEDLAPPPGNTFMGQAPHHPFEGCLSGTPDRPCLACGLPDRHPIHTFGVIRPQMTITLQDNGTGNTYSTGTLIGLLLQLENEKDRASIIADVLDELEISSHEINSLRTK